MNPAAHALVYPFETGRLPWPITARTCFLNAEELPGWHAPAPECVQTFKPLADPTDRRYGQCSPELPDAGAAFDVVLVLPPRARAWSRALLAHAARLAKPEGLIVLAAENEAGGKSHAADLKQLLGQVTEASKHKCRIAWATAAQVNTAVASAWLAEAAPRQRADGLWTQAGVFSADAVDPATAMLVAALPTTLAGHVADFGAGAGVIARHLAMHAPGVRQLSLYEAEARSLAMARRNLADVAVPCNFHWADVTCDVSGRFDAIVMNPPFHGAGKAGVPELGQRFIEVAASHLSAGGQVWLVANAHLPYEAVLAKRFGDVTTVVSARNYKVIRATGPRP